jgi:hypothetical protein
VGRERERGRKRKKNIELYAEIEERIRSRNEAFIGVPDANKVVIHNPELAMRVQHILRYVDYKWTIKEILEQPEPLTSDVFTIDRIVLGYEDEVRIEGDNVEKVLNEFGKLDG